MRAMKPDSCWELWVNSPLDYMQIDREDYIVNKYLLESIKEGEVNIRCITAIKGVCVSEMRDIIV